MFERLTSETPWARVLRLVLVFALVFWSCFHVQALAFAALVSDSGAAHEEGSLSNLTVWQADGDDASRIAGAVRDARATMEGAPQPNVPSIDADGSSAVFVAIPTWTDGAPVATGEGDVVAADFVTWRVSDSSVASLTAQGGVATLVGLQPGTITVTCSLAAGREGLVASDLDSAAFAVSFEVEVRAVEAPAVAPYVSSIEIQKPDGTACIDNEQIVLQDSERSSYALAAKVNVYDEAAGESYSFATTPERGLAAASDGRFPDLTWEALASDGSPADPSEVAVSGGVVTLSGDGPAIVRCTSAAGLNDIPVTAQVIVRSADAQAGPAEGDAQGADNHQDQLKVTIVGNVPSWSAAEEGEDSAQDGTEADVETAEAAGGASEEKGDGDAGADAASEQPASEPVTKAYSLAELQAALDFGTETYTMSTAGGSITVSGEGPTLAAVLYLAGIAVADQTSIESIEFVGFSGASTTVSWSDLVAVSRPSIMVAARSYVHAGEGASDASSAGDSGDAPAVEPPGSSEAPQLLDNTRFRLLYNGGGSGALANPDAFRWISEIVVNMEGGEKPDPTPDPGDDPQVFVDYVPVPRGSVALLNPRYYLPSSTRSFNYTWQSSDDGTTWVDVPDDGVSQTLHIPTDDEHIGRYYRFKLIINPQEDGGNDGEIASSPVKIRAAGEQDDDEPFIVVLDYVPPIAGDVANFTSQVMMIGGEVDLSRVSYTWQASLDGGLTWKGGDDADGFPLLAEQSGLMCSTLRIPTDPIAESDPSAEPNDDASDEPEDGEAQQVIYIRVIATYDGHTAYSNAQPLTVHVGDSGGEKADQIQEQIDGAETADDGSGENTPADEPAEPVNPPVPQQPQPQVSITEVDHVVYESSSAPAEEPRPDTPAAPGVEISQVYVNPEVSQQVVEQQQAVEEYVASTTPGARWTQLTTVNPTGDDVRAVLAANPFAPFAAPMALGLTAAGAVEKFLTFRRQTR